MNEIVIDCGFRGLPRLGNGGYVCSILAKTLDHVVEVTSLKPVPLRDLANSDGLVAEEFI